MLRRTIVGYALVLVISGALLSPAGADQPPVRYDGHKLVQVTLRSEQDVRRMLAISSDYWSEGIGVGTFDFRVPPERMDELAASGLKYIVRHENIQELIDAEREAMRRAPRGWFDSYRSYAEVDAYIDTLVDERPDLVSRLEIGTSIEGRTICGMRVSSPLGGPDKPALVFDGAQHAREWIALMVPMYIADALVHGYDGDPQVRRLLDAAVVYVFPLVNPDGYEYSRQYDRLWRKNRRYNGGGSYGVDLNRNWAYNWGGDGSSGNPWDNTYRGTAPFSEPEAAAVADFIAANPNIRAHIDFHSYSQLILYPFSCCYQLPPEPDLTTFVNLSADMAEAIYSVHGMVYTPEPGYDLYLASGVAMDWVYGDQDVFSWTIELRDTGYYGFLLPPEQIIPTGQENFAAVKLLIDYFSALLRFEFPEGLPLRVDPHSQTAVRVDIVPVNAEMEPGSGRLLARIGSGGEFSESALTPLGGDSYEGVLPAAACGTVIQYYFQARTTEGQVVTSPADAPESVYQADVLEEFVIYENLFDADPGWSTQDLWAFGRPTGRGGEYGGPDPTSGHSGQNVYGYNLDGDYQNNLPERHLTSTPLDCTGQQGVRLRFWRWLGVEQPAYDHAYVRVSNDGTSWTTVWENPREITDSAWVPMDLDISAIADDQPTVYLRWTMGPTDRGWRYCGWNIDDTQLVALGCAQSQPGDLNGDGCVDQTDLGILLSDWGCAGGDCAGDADGDGDTDQADLGLLLDHWGAGCG